MSGSLVVASETEVAVARPLSTATLAPAGPVVADPSDCADATIATPGVLGPRLFTATVAPAGPVIADPSDCADASIARPNAGIATVGTPAAEMPVASASERVPPRGAPASGMPGRPNDARPSGRKPVATVIVPLPPFSVDRFPDVPPPKRL